MSNLICYVLSGLLGVSNMILWGLYGDLLLEPFSQNKVFRSLSLGVIFSLFLYWVNSSLPPILVVFIVIAFERITTEIYKALIRDERQFKYKIPSDLNIDFPRSVEKLVGIAAIILLPIIFMYLRVNLSYPILILIAVFVPALGGMLKDAPYEGFQFLKFIRSPIVVALVGYFLFRFFSHYEQKYLLVALWGGERIISEFYKKILNGHVPGKFKKNIFHRYNKKWKRDRKWLLVPYFINIVLLIFIGVYSVVSQM